jgi:hypothetical protein
LIEEDVRSVAKEPDYRRIQAMGLEHSLQCSLDVMLLLRLLIEHTSTQVLSEEPTVVTL